MEDNLEVKIEQIKKDTEDIVQADFINEMIKNNYIEFEVNNVKYRANKPSFKDKQKANQEKTKKFIAMLKDSEAMLEVDLIKLYATRGISIAELDDEFAVLKKQKEDLSLKLGQALTEGKPKEELDVFKKEIDFIVGKQSDLMIKKSVLLDASLESQLMVFIYTYLGYLVTQKLENDKWVTAWATYDDFLKEEESVVNKVVWYSSLLTKNEVS